ncbi:hypothetical protein QTO34_014980 [Cnephaeus nilssonii]|uniref:RNA-directed DNA polymerase n=1 Tax=Cnephaeus nilssonii TaxID=3371016 RepID=A0AA40LC95_CNENI|nr:hypothetical protein QTO34_014980 [Eptesicus nilssonii]
MFKITREQARQIVKTCSICTLHLPTPDLGVNPRGLIPNALWQMDVTHFPEFGNLKYIHVSIDTYSGFIFATLQTGEATKNVIAHLLTTFSVLGCPQQIKTDNGPGYTSSGFSKFCKQMNITHITGIPYNPQGQGIVMETITQILLQGIMLILIPMTNGGLGPPINKQELLLKLFGNPCDCRGGKSGVIPTSYTRIADCGSSTAFLIYKRQMGGGYEQSWKCVEKPKIIPMVNGEPGPCPSDCQKAIVLHSTCYNSVQQCSHTDGKIYLTAVLQRTYSGSFGGKYDYSHPLGHSKYAQASCRGRSAKIFVGHRKHRSTCLMAVGQQTG